MRVRGGAGGAGGGAANASCTGEGGGVASAAGFWEPNATSDPVATVVLEVEGRAASGAGAEDPAAWETDATRSVSVVGVSETGPEGRTTCGPRFDALVGCR